MAAVSKWRITNFCTAHLIWVLKKGFFVIDVFFYFDSYQRVFCSYACYLVGLFLINFILLKIFKKSLSSSKIRSLYQAKSNIKYPGRLCNGKKIV